MAKITFKHIDGESGHQLTLINEGAYSRSRAARNAGRRRFAQLDRDLERYAALSRRRDGLASRLASAEARERAADQAHTDRPIRTEGTS